MLAERILELPPRLLTQKQREAYFEDGFLLVERFLDDAWLERLRGAVARQVERSREVTESGAVFDLEPGHSASEPRLRRISSPHVQDRVFWDYVAASPLVDLLCDLLGPDVVFHHSKLNFKWAQGGTEVKWHQDAAFFPHTNPAVLTVGTYLNECGMAQGPLALLPGSHRGPIYDHYADDGSWTGHIADADVPRLPLDTVRYLCGPAGSVTLHNYRTVHGSEPNRSDLGRPLLLNTVSAADAVPYCYNPLLTEDYRRAIAGRPAKWAHHEPGDYLIPPDWSGGYTSIFATQQAKKSAA